MNILIKKSFLLLFCVISVFCVLRVEKVNAASLSLSPNTGVYSAGSSFTARVIVNTAGQPINAAEGDISFNPDDLSVVSISKAGSIFTLWTKEPEFSNATGKISFGGGSPSGYTGNSGTIMLVTFRTKHAGTSNVTYSAGSILAADGKGTNVVSGMQGGTYTTQAVTTEPAPEYVPPANTPSAPQVSSKTHPDQSKWYTEKRAELSWKLPEGVTSVRTLLDEKAGTIPTKVYEEPISSVTLDLDEGTSYFHIQFKNKEGWGRLTNYRLNVDTSKPESFTITLAEGNDVARPDQKLHFEVKDEGSGVAYYMIQIDGGERQKYEDKDTTKTYTTPSLAPGAHTVVVEAYDHSNNSIVASIDLTVEAFDAPVFTEYPTEFSSAVIPVIKGTTRSDADVTVSVSQVGSTPTTYLVHAGEDGVFVFIPPARFSEGVYELSAIAKDSSGSISRESEKIRIAVQESGMVRVGGMVVTALSVIVPLLGLVALLLGMVWYGWHRAQTFRKRVRKETTEAEQSLVHEFHGVISALEGNVAELKEARKGRLTKQEQDLVTALADNLRSAQKRIQKELEDIEKLAKR